MSALKSQRQINLLPKDKFSETALGKVLSWFLSTFRVMVILVELIVVFAFLFKVWLDTKNSDLSEEIKQKEAQIKAYETQETSFRKLQNKAKTFSIITSTTKAGPAIAQVSTLTPPSVTLTSLTFSENKMNIEAITLNENNLLQFLTNLKSSKKFSKVKLYQINPDKEDKGTIKFKINLEIKEDQVELNNQQKQ
jgi:Tfp pilus assembly protein PilN